MHHVQHSSLNLLEQKSSNSLIDALNKDRVAVSVPRCQVETNKYICCPNVSPWQLKIIVRNTVPCFYHGLQVLLSANTVNCFTIQIWIMKHSECMKPKSFSHLSFLSWTQKIKKKEKNPLLIKWTPNILQFYNEDNFVQDF